MSPRILVRGSNDIGSAIAHRLFRAGDAIVLHDIPLPTVTRRKMAFTDAIFDGQAVLENIRAVRVDDLALITSSVADYQIIPIVTSDFDQLLKTLQPVILIDARMRKHQQPEPQLGLAPLTIGLGPNFTAGETTDLVVETSWGEVMGKVIDQGSSSPLEGEPREIGGHARDRYVYAPAAGIFYTNYAIGDQVEQGQVIARVEKTDLLAPLAGTLRGLTHSGVPVSLRAKVIEVVPHGATAQIEGIAERPARIAEGVFNAVQRWKTFNPA